MGNNSYQNRIIDILSMLKHQQILDRIVIRFVDIRISKPETVEEIIKENYIFGQMIIGYPLILL